MSEIEYQIELAMLHADQEMDAQEDAMLHTLNEQTHANRCDAELETAKKMDLLLTESMRQEQRSHWKNRWAALKTTAASLTATVVSGLTPLVLPSLGPLAFTVMCLSAAWFLHTLTSGLIPEVSWFAAHKEELE